MFSLTNSIWLFAIAALSVPVIIHLWNIRPGKTLKVGSIALMSQASRKSSRSLNLLDVLLLLLRCLFLLLLAFLLAGPFWSVPVQPGKIKGWVLIPKENINETYHQFKSKMDSLTKAGYELHYFDRGFEKLSPEKVAQLQNNASKDSISAKAQQYWPLLAGLNTIIPPILPVYLFTPNGIGHFTGKRADVSLNLHWQTYLPADSTSTWIQSAAYTPEAGRIRVIQGNSSPAGTTFNYTTLQGTEQRSSPYQISFNNGQPVVSLKDGKTSVAVDTSTLYITVYSDKNSSDAKYLMAALDAVKQFTGRKISIQSTENDNRLPGKPDWVFWLRERKMPTMAGENIFSYVPGKTQNIQSDISFGGEEKIALYKHIADSSITIQNLWKDGFGNPVLSVDSSQDFHHYHFYSRFNPAWNDLVWSASFPKVIMNLILKPSASKKDRRSLDAAQIVPAISEPDTHTITNKLNDITDLSKAFWLVLIVLFVTERWLAHKTKPVENYG